MKATISDITTTMHVPPSYSPSLPFQHYPCLSLSSPHHRRPPHTHTHIPRGNPPLIRLTWLSSGLWGTWGTPTCASPTWVSVAAQETGKEPGTDFRYCASTVASLPCKRFSRHLSSISIPFKRAAS
jgi:hypothetical protein